MSAPSLIVSRMQAALAAGTFTFAELVKTSGMPAATLRGLRDGAKPKSVSRLRPLLAALNRLDPKVKPHLASRVRVQAEFDPARPVRMQLPDIERDLMNFGVPLSSLLDRAGVPLRTWQRWRAGDARPAFETWLDVLAAAQTVIELKAIDLSHTKSPAGTGVA